MKVTYPSTRLFAILPLLLVACAQPDTDRMQTGLQKAGMDAAQARCYTEALAEALEADMFNQVAAYLDQGERFDDATTRARRKFGLDFRQRFDAVEPSLKACRG
jgi:hypothetical protein